MLKIVRHAHARTGLKNLCLVGGVALNSVANGRIMREGPFESVYIQPAAGDAGGAVGAALYTYHVLLDKPRTFVMEHAYWGQVYSVDESKAVLEASSYTGKHIEDINQLAGMMVDEWLIPMISALLVLGLLMIFASASGVGPFIYSLF
jgi:carbamoyltransferase